jgi:hypothetical protein
MKRLSLFVAILLVLSLLLLIGLGGAGMSVKVDLDEQYHPYSTGHVLIELSNGWWWRAITIQNISLLVSEITYYDWQTGNYTADIPPSQTLYIQANLTIREYRLGTFAFNLTIEYLQTTVFGLGSERMEKSISGNITIS